MKFPYFSWFKWFFLKSVTFPWLEKGTATSRYSPFSRLAWKPDPPFKDWVVSDWNTLHSFSWSSPHQQSGIFHNYIPVFMYKIKYHLNDIPSRRWFLLRPPKEGMPIKTLLDRWPFSWIDSISFPLYITWNIWLNPTNIKYW